MKLTILFFVVISFVCGDPQRNPNSEYELISGWPQGGATIKPPLDNGSNNKHNTPKSIVTPPPPPLNSKTFAYDPKTQTWTQIKKNDPAPNEDTLLWNQSNDKWLTRR